MSATLQASSTTKDSPISETEFATLIDNEKDKLTDTHEFIRSITNQLSVKSSKFKFLVEVTSVSSSESITTNVTITSSIGSLWDDERDGYYSFKVQTKDVYLVTVYWIYAD
ncbi:hypothetical protein EJF18_50294 [Clavispora lusitaniae]|uniref:Topoisomerase I damage affected protein 2 n=2 Tax=Clavispora lusitaniae TaxID=36911 RepID=TDA2_CLAL4|nr:uncharacterized protein CLUG_04533 [Clavispora lusitaniae ATCC 42720]C4Y8K5.1 RecName: Full=Topoisomerase I damage affected protein 2 [Clavispora lusitaniae ATCC 42720]KAF7581657.1 Tctex-1 family protein [Clavispora lusitaniae]EEQ40405.1 predicted protein [Clavispora lusitaniae ATCC 42720]QFZ29069.1 hypothetical protein EJF14_50294 [Clavispora lusitaniae]QFZ34732.1 hypothetical protein EJF16_50294 [Clavispora lusitaniae]QFZ40417.1 hypothetical protein EJF15_50294 [Clavispora lusitaniae]